MKEIVKYTAFRSEIEAYFEGLHYAHRLMISWLLTRVDLKTGYVENITYQQIANLLRVTPTSGRNNTGTPKKQAIRSYMRSIEKQCPEHFKISSRGQFLRIEFLSLPKIYASYFEQTEVYIEKNSNSYLDMSFPNQGEGEGSNSSNKVDPYTQVYTDQYTSELPVKNNNYLNKNKTNNNKPDTSKFFISDSFFPSAETLLRAKAKGFDNADDLAEIQAFIDHNKAIGSQWADFNPIYLRWLENGKDRKTRQIKVKKSGSINNGTSCTTYKKSPKQRVIDAYSNEFDYCEQTGRFYAKGTDSFNEKPEPQPIKYIDIDSLGPID